MLYWIVSRRRGMKANKTVYSSLLKMPAGQFVTCLQTAEHINQITPKDFLNGKRTRESKEVWKTMIRMPFLNLPILAINNYLHNDCFFCVCFLFSFFLSFFLFRSLGWVGGGTVRYITRTSFCLISLGNSDSHPKYHPWNSVTECNCTRLNGVMELYNRCF